jgi:protein-tyrosine phosphatase
MRFVPPRHRLFSSLCVSTPKCFDNPDEGLPVLVHCSVGKSRSTSVVIAYLMIHKGMTFKEAMTLTRSKRARAYPIMHFWKEVRHTQEHRGCYLYRA